MILELCKGGHVFTFMVRSKPHLEVAVGIFLINFFLIVIVFTNYYWDFLSVVYCLMDFQYYNFSFVKIVIISLVTFVASLQCFLVCCNHRPVLNR